MKALTDFDPDVPTHSPTARMPMVRPQDRARASSSYLLAVFFFFAPVFLARPGLRRARTVDDALNFTVFEAGILSASPVIRLRPMRAPRLAIENVPIGVRTEPPLTTVFSMMLNTASTAARAFFALLLVTLATEATRSASDMAFPPR